MQHAWRSPQEYQQETLARAVERAQRKVCGMSCVRTPLSPTYIHAWAPLSPVTHHQSHPRAHPHPHTSPPPSHATSHSHTVRWCVLVDNVNHCQHLLSPQAEHQRSREQADPFSSHLGDLPPLRPRSAPYTCCVHVLCVCCASGLALMHVRSCICEAVHYVVYLLLFTLLFVLLFVGLLCPLRELLPVCHPLTQVTRT